MQILAYHASPYAVAILVLEGGAFFEGRAVSAGEARFTTATAGCEEAVTDPS
jgi:carbamoylphosphate synthase small subunit